MLSRKQTFNNEDPKFILRSKRIQYSHNILAQYLSAIYFSSWEKALTILLDFNLFLLVFASSLTIASGYIINNFMTAKDLINRPNKSSWID
jgi:hypothetical protein